jgi:ABC-type nitrate/sulfonate/bicarbonate transport system ATPase subunit
MTLTELITQGAPRIIALDQWQYRGKPTLLKIVALADNQDQHRVTAVFDPESQLVLAVEVFTDTSTLVWEQAEFNAELPGEKITAAECLTLVNTLLADEQLDRDTDL